MKIAFFTDTYAPEVNGVTNTLSKFGSYLDKNRFQHIVIAPEYESENSLGISEYRKVYRFKGMTTPLSPESRLAFPSFWEIDHICDRFRPDIIHVTTELGIGFRGMRYALSRGIPLVMSYHTNYCQYLKYHNLEFLRPIIENYLAWFYHFPARTLAPSRHTLKELFSKGYRGLELWSRGIDSGSFNPEYRDNELRGRLGKDRFIFLYVGRLSREKNLDLLLDAASETERRYPGRTMFVFTGDGPYAETIQKCALPNTLLTGFKRGKDLSQIYASADCFAFPSGTETFGNVVLEAMASGLPIAGVSSGGVTDFLSHNHNALLCDPEDTKSFTGNLISLMEDENLRLRLAANAQKTALSRDWNRIFDGLIDVYAAAIAEYRQPPILKAA